MHRAAFAPRHRTAAFPRHFEVQPEPDQSLVLNPTARHDAPAAPARFVGRKLRAGHKVQHRAKAAFATYKPRSKNYE